MIRLKGLCRRSICLITFPIVLLVILTIISAYFYQHYLLNREKDLRKLIKSLKSVPLLKENDRKPLKSLELPYILRKSIEDYLSTDHDKYVIISSGTGVGNRLQSIVSALVFGLVSNRRLLIHWSPTKLSGCQFDELFVSPIGLSSMLLTLYSEEYLFDHSEQLSFHGPFDELLCHSNLSLFKKESQFLFLSTDEYFLSVLVKNPAYSQHLFVNVSEEILFGSLVNYLFEPRKELKDKIASYESKHGHCHKGIHMRKEGLKQIPTNGEQVFLDCVLNRTKSVNESWFLATDYPRYKEYFRWKINSTQISLLTLESSGETNKCSDVQEALIELWLLTKCDELFLTHWSSFSWLASGLSGVHPIIVQSNSCHVQPFARPCYYELTHLKQLSCFNSKQMFESDPCCSSEHFCENDCLHHDYRNGSHFFYFLIIWPMFELVKWLFKWIFVIFFILFLLNRIQFHWDIDTLMNIYKKLLLIVVYVSIVFVDIRCLFWSKRKVI